MAPPAGLQWIVFANHTHTTHSYDGEATVEQRIKDAAARGANAISITDHWAVSQCGDPAFQTWDGCIPMCGEEWGLPEDGHVGLLNLKGELVADARIEDMVAHGLFAGATLIVNHPRVAVVPWPYDDVPPGIHGIELWSTPLFVLGSAGNIAWWHSLLAKGRTIFGIGGSDMHVLAADVLAPCNHVLAKDATPDSIQEALENRRVTIAEDEAAPRCLIWCDTDGDGTFETPVGNIINVAQSRTLRFRVEVFNGAGYSLAAITRTGEQAPLTVGEGTPWIADFTADVEKATRDFVRAELRDPPSIGYPMKGLTNPIYVNYTPGDADSDGVTDADELRYGTDMYNADTDGDGVSDGYETAVDGNAAEYNPYNPDTNPTGTDMDARSRDTDKDGIDDGVELTFGGNPLDPLNTVTLPATGFPPTFLCLLLATLRCLYAMRKTRFI